MPLDLELIGIHAAYGEMAALFGVDIAVPHGSVTALLGPNGAGKTTSLRVATGILRPTKGQVRFKGQDATRTGIRALAAQGLCMVPEGRGIFPSLTVKDNLLIHTHLAGRAAAEKVQETAFTTFPVLGQRSNQVAGTLSGGEQQMLALSRVLTTNPSVVLLDEISMGLAPLIVEELFRVVKQLAVDGTTILLVEQLAQDALEIADYVYVLNQGRLSVVGEPQEVRDVIVRSYMGNSSGAPDNKPGDSALAGGGATTFPDGQLVATANGSMAHHQSCPIARFATELHVPTAAQLARRCGLCDEMTLAVISE
jgi:branched-chain amino acid transport system ATP-binding protein